MKMPYVIGSKKLGIAAIVLLCALSTGSQQQEVHPANAESGCKTGGQWEPGCYEKLVQTIPTVKGKAEYLARVADTLQTQIQTANLGIQNANRVADTLQTQIQAADMEKKLGFEPAGTYQIAATNVVVAPGESWTQVFRINTRTGSVCQVVGTTYRTGEAMGTSIPICTN
jgi:hypothetical protein